MLSHQKYLPIDRALLKAAQKVKVLYYLEPLNRDEEKKKFLTGKIKKPKFVYRELEYQPPKVRRQLRGIKIPDDELGRLFRRKRRSLLRHNKAIINRGRKKLLRQIALRGYRPPSKRLVNVAKQWLREIFPVKSPKTVSSKKMKKTLEKALANYGLDDWWVELSDKKLTTVYRAEKKISLCQEKKFARNSLERLVIHEVGVHVLRAANGYRQPLKIFVSGLPGYLSTEEGLACYFEELIGKLDANKKRDYAARVIAVDAARRGLGFKGTFEKLKKYGLTNDQAWGTTIRVYRGGGWFRAHVYLQGYLRVKRFAEKGGDLKTLYLGKIGLQHLSLAEKLLKKRFLKPAKYLPDFLR